MVPHNAATLLEMYSEAIVREAVLDVDRAYTGSQASNRSDRGMKYGMASFNTQKMENKPTWRGSLHNGAIHELRPDAFVVLI